MWAYERCVCCLGAVVASAFLVGELKLKKGYILLSLTFLYLRYNNTFKLKLQLSFASILFVFYLGFFVFLFFVFFFLCVCVFFTVKCFFFHTVRMKNKFHLPTNIFSFLRTTTFGSCKEI